MRSPLRFPEEVPLSRTTSFMPFDQQGVRIALAKLHRHLTKLGKKPAPKSVHRFRTYSRRIEALVGELVAKPTRNQKKVLQLLARLRKKAGRVRDLDVQVAALRSLKIPQEPERKARLMRTLLEERARSERKLRKAFGKETVDELRRRLKRMAKSTEIPAGIDPVAKALQLFAEAGKDHGAITESRLHEYRTIGKRARYVAELAGGEDAAANRVTDHLKQMQDAIGDWHDWLKLTQQARDLFGTVQESPLVAALQNLTRAKFRHALDAVARTQAALTPRPAAAESARVPLAHLAQVSTAA